MTPEKAFGLTLKELRKEKQISQEKLSFDCELDRTYISLLERGLRQPTLTTILQIAKALKISPQLFFENIIKNIKKDGE